MKHKIENLQSNNLDSDLLDEEKYTVYTYLFTIDNDGTITLVNVEDNSKQILKKDTSSGSMYK